MKETKEVLDALVASSDKLDNLRDDKRNGVQVKPEQFLIAIMDLLPKVTVAFTGSEGCKAEIQAALVERAKAEELGATIFGAAFDIYNDFKNPEA